MAGGRMKHYTESQVLATLRAALKRCSQRELAQALDFQESTLSAVLSGHRELPVVLAEKLGFEAQGRWYTRKQPGATS